MIVPRDLAVPAAFLAEGSDLSPSSPGVTKFHDVYAFAAVFPNFKINAYVGVDRDRGDPYKCFLTPESGQIMFGKTSYCMGEQFWRPLWVQFTIVDASGRGYLRNPSSP